ncbi:hypothetical protein FQR65_LT08293 [Abscondita terminalis]|nr:hypothetical protein FQR65_LT08293 [Abscondita terminalis]
MLGSKLIYLYSCLLIFSSNCLCQNVTKYLNDLQDNTKTRLADLIADKRKDTDYQYDIHFEKGQYFMLPENSTNVTTIKDNNYIFFRGQTYSAIFRNGIFDLQKVPGKWQDLSEHVNLMRVTKYNNLRLLFISVAHESRVYLEDNVTDQWKIIQTIATKRNVSDVLFFTNVDRLYLIILNNADHWPSLSIVYKWTGTHFDQIHKFDTINPLSISSFHLKRSEIIVILQKHQNKSEVHVFEFNKDLLIKTQLVINNCSHIITYSFKDKHYLVTMGDAESSILYQWNGFEFARVGKIDEFPKIEKTFLAYMNEGPLVFVFEQNELLAFYHSANNLRLINKMSFNDVVTIGTEILDVHMMFKFPNVSALLVFLKSSKGEVGYMTIPFRLSVTQKVANAEFDEIVKCMLKLEEFINNFTGNHNSQQIIKKTIADVAEEQKFNDSFLASAAHTSTQNVVVDISQDVIESVEQQIKIVTERLVHLRAKLPSFHTKNRTLAGKLLVLGNLHVNKFKADKLTVKNVNSIEWNPSLWLSYSKPQTITGSVIAKNLIVKNLTVPKKSKLFKGLLLRNGNQNITGPFYMQSLQVNNIYVQKINNIAFEDVYLRTSPTTIRGTKRFDVVNARQTSIVYLNKENASDAIQRLSRTQSKKYSLGSNAYIKNLNFNEINGITWNDFKRSLFRLGFSNKIRGNLSIRTLKCNKLYTIKLGEIDASSLFTVTTDQYIKSVIHWTYVLSHDVTCNKINNVNFNDIAFANNIIQGPISMDRTRIRGNLYLNYPEQVLNENDLDEHIIGTDISDLVQKYNKRVKITGNLFIKNISVLKGAQVIVNGVGFNDNLENTYWSKTKFQNIPFFEAENGITTTHLSTVTLNNVLVSQYLTNDLEDKLPIHWIFKNVVIMGNVEVNPSVNHIPDVAQIDLLSVKRIGRFKIANKIQVQGNIRIKNLVTKYLDDVKVDDAINLQNNLQIFDQIMLNNVVIKGDLICTTLVTNNINKYQLQYLDDAVLHVDRDEYIENLWCNEVTAHDGAVTNINQNNFDTYTQYLERLYTITTLNNLKVNGQVKIRYAQNVNCVNGYEISKLSLKVVFFVINSISVLIVFLQNLDEHVFPRNVKVLGKVSADTLEVVYVNGVNFSHLCERVLFKEWDQNVNALYTFDQLNTPNIFVPTINGILLKNLISTNTTKLQTLVVPRTLHLRYPKFLKSLNSERMVCNIERAVGILQNPPSAYWNTIEVSQNATLWDTNCHLNAILEQAVHSKKDNFIYSQVIFDHHISAKNIDVKKLINGIHLNDIFNDAILKDEEEQIITGKKNFYRLAVANGFSESVYIPVINEIDIKVLNDSIIDSNNIYGTVITGSKIFFSGLQANRLMTNSISNVDPQSLVSLNNLMIIPKAYFKNLYVDGNLNVVSVNNVNFSNFMNQRLLSNTDNVQIASGIYFIDSAVFWGNTETPFVNDILIDDIVLDHDVQIINAPKHFTNNISINNNILIELLNGQELNLLFNNSLLLGNDQIIEGSITFHNVSMFANVETEKLNEMPIINIEEYIRSGSPVVQNDLIQSTMEKMDNEIKTSLILSKEMSDHYLYLEKSNELQIYTTNVSYAYAYFHKDTVMLYIIQHSPGNECGLDAICSCPLQQILQITNEKSIQTIAQSNDHRVFSYEGDDISVHLVTNSISTSELCRNVSGFNETTTLMWITYSPNGAVNHSALTENLPGFISRVEYFNYNNNLYIVVARFYEPINNTHNVPCLVFRITKGKSEVELIQTIMVDSAWVLNLFHTAQGISIIIGSLSTESKLNDYSGVSVYRFQENIEQFVLLRKMPGNGCTSAVSVVLGSDSLIVVACKESPLQVFKYHPKFDNYYFSQNIFTDNAVIGLSVFYEGNIGMSDSYLCIVTKNGNFFIYSYRYIEGWKIRSSGEIEGLQLLVPFKLGDTHYLFAASNKLSLLLNEEINSRVECRTLAIDLRGHGRTSTQDDSNLALDILASDIKDIIRNIYADEPPPFVLIGHSLGGAVAVEAAKLLDTVVGVCVIDVVEGSALDSLSSMQSILRGRPDTFISIEQAIQWSYRTGQTHNLVAARISMPGQIKNLSTGELAANEIWTDSDSVIRTKISRLCDTKNSSLFIPEEDEEADAINVECSQLQNNSVPDISVPSKSTRYGWRIDLKKTEPFWQGWFKGLSQKFLELQAPKVLILANIHGMDTALTVGQMQGKFQLQVLPRSGHAIHEDQPHQVADIIASFLVKQRLALPKNDFTIFMPAC